MYPINFAATRENFFLSLQYKKANNYLFANATKMIKFKTKDYEFVASPVCLGNISKNVPVNNIKNSILWF